MNLIFGQGDFSMRRTLRGVKSFHIPCTLFNRTVGFVVRGGFGIRLQASKIAMWQAEAVSTSIFSNFES